MLHVMSFLRSAVSCVGLAHLGWLAQVPAAYAQAPKFETTKVAEGVYSFRHQFHRNMFVVTSDGVIVTDPISPEAATNLMAEIRKVSDKPVKYVIYSHEHWDHILGGKVFKDGGAQFVAQENCVDYFARRPNPALVPPDQTFKDRHEIKLGETTVELRYFGRNHGHCMTVMLLPKEKILFAVDIVGHKRAPFRIMPDYFPADWVRSLKEIEKLEFERIIPGHGAAIVPAESVRLTREYVEDLMAAVETAMKETQDPIKLKETVKLPKYQDWFGYEAMLPLNIERIYAHYTMGW